MGYAEHVKCVLAYIPDKISSTQSNRNRKPYPNSGPAERAVLRIALLRERDPQGGVEEGHHPARRVEVLEEEEDQCELVQEVHAEDHAPEGGVRPDEGAVAELDHGEHDEGEYRGVHAAVRGLRLVGGRRREGVHASFVAPLFEDILCGGDVREEGEPHSEGRESDRLVEEPSRSSKRLDSESDAMGAYSTLVSCRSWKGVIRV